MFARCMKILWEENSKCGHNASSFLNSHITCESTEPAVYLTEWKPSSLHGRPGSTQTGLCQALTSSLTAVLLLATPWTQQLIPNVCIDYALCLKCVFLRSWHSCLLVTPLSADSPPLYRGPPRLPELGGLLSLYHSTLYHILLLGLKWSAWYISAISLYIYRTKYHEGRDYLPWIWTSP